MKGYPSFEVFQLLTESQRQPGEPLYVEPRGPVQPLDMASRDEFHFRLARDQSANGRGKMRSTVLALWMLRGVVHIHLHALPIIHIRTKLRSIAST